MFRTLALVTLPLLVTVILAGFATSQENSPLRDGNPAIRDGPPAIRDGNPAIREGAPANRQSASEPPAASALRTMFSPLEVPRRQTMGLLQRNFMDMASSGQGRLQVAIVIDGTHSMAAELNGVRQSISSMLADLRRFRADSVEAAIVVYRDQGSPSGEVSVPLDQFTTDVDRITTAAGSLEPETGAPFFHELVDLGLYTAIDGLPWSEDPNVTKWILLFGDAPPYATTFRDPQYPSARRRYSDALISSLAGSKGISVHCVLCTSGDANSESYSAVIDQTRQFMSSIAADTGGIMLDLSYPEIQKALVEADHKQRIEFSEIAPINAADLRAVARTDIPDPGDPSAVQTVSMAVVPHEALATMAFEPNRASVQVAAAVRHRMASLPGVRCVSSVDIQRQLRRVRAEGLADDQTLRGLTARLNVDYVVWGQLPDPNTIQTAAYRRSDGAAIVQVAFDGDRGKLADVILTAAAQDSDSDEPLAQLARRVQSAAERAILESPIAETTGTTNEILTALEALEQSLALPAGDDAALPLLQTAVRTCTAAASAEPRNPLPHWLHANAAFNLAAIAFEGGSAELAADWTRQFRSSLRKAYAQKDRIASPALRLEVESDHALLISRDVEAAVSGYRLLTKFDMPLSSQLRAHWTLSGIYAGDWGVPATVRDAAESRKHVIEILANWPDSSEAEQLKRWLLWDEQTDQTRHNYLPKIHLPMYAEDDTQI